MTRIAATADWHVGASPDLAETPQQRLRDQADALHNMTDAIATQKPDAILFAGDATHRPRPTPAELLVVRDTFDRLADIAPVIAINGNAHDVIGPDQPIALQLVRRNGFSLQQKPGVLAATHRYGDDALDVACLPWTPPSILAAQHGRDGEDERAAAMLIDVAAGLRADCGDNAVLMLHWSVSQATSATGIATSLFHEPVLNIDDLLAQGWAGIVCGHIHVPQSLAGEPHAFYCGSPMPVDWSEDGYLHGYWMLDTDTGVATFHDVPSRPLRTFEIHSEPDVDGGVRLALGYCEPGSVLRFVVKSEGADPPRVDHASIRALAAEHYCHVAQIRIDHQRQTRARDVRATDSLGTLEAVEVWADAQGLDEATSTAVISRTSSYLTKGAASCAS